MYLEDFICSSHLSAALCKNHFIICSNSSSVDLAVGNHRRKKLPATLNWTSGRGWMGNIKKFFFLLNKLTTKLKLKKFHRNYELLLFERIFKQEQHCARLKTVWTSKDLKASEDQHRSHWAPWNLLKSLLKPRDLSFWREGMTVYNQLPESLLS